MQGNTSTWNKLHGQLFSFLMIRTLIPSILLSCWRLTSHWSRGRRSPSSRRSEPGSAAVQGSSVWPAVEKKDKDRRKGIGRRCSLRYRIYSIPCRASCFWRTGWIHPFLSNHPGAIYPIIQNCPRQKTASAARMHGINSSPCKQKRRPLPFLPSLSFPYGLQAVCLTQKL